MMAYETTAEKLLGDISFTLHTRANLKSKSI
jgi:hypothetical protein